MQITLKNGEDIELEITPLLLEYIEEYEGGIEQLQKDTKSNDRSMLAVNHILYSVICSNYDEPLTYRQAIRLIQINDMYKIADFVVASLVKEEQVQNNNISNIHRM